MLCFRVNLYQVHTLWLDNNEIGATGAKALAEGLLVHKSVTELSLADNPLRTDGFEHIAQVNCAACQV